MRIDINAFFGHWPYWPLPHTSGDDALRLMDRFHIDHAAIASLRGLHGDWKESNTETLALARSHRDRLTPVACISPMSGGGGKALRQLVEQGFRGIRLYPLMLQGYSLSGEFAEEIASTAGAVGVPLIIPTRPMMNFRFAVIPINDIAALAQQHPQTTFVLSGPNYLSEFQTSVEEMRRCANIMIETSCMQGFHAVRRLVEAVGKDRVLFGTGLPLHYPACNVAKLEHADLTDSQHAAVGGGNAARVLGLQTEST
jgi:predicted TIM-barrel fold metal-dependent hydrolase